MGIVLDYTSRIAPSALKGAGVVGVCRYLSPDQPSTRWKVITPSEYRELRANGIEVHLNWEYTARDWMGGAATGRAHGTAAQIEAHALGYPPGSVILGSADFDMTRTDWNSAGRAYATGFAAGVRAGGYRPGVYGPWDVLQWVADERLMDAFWQAGMSTAWSSGRNRDPHPLAHLRQRGHKTVGGVDTDWNEIRRPLWSGGSLAAGKDDIVVWYQVPDGKGGGNVYNDNGVLINASEFPDSLASRVPLMIVASVERMQELTGARVTIDPAAITASVTATVKEALSSISPVDQSAVEQAVEDGVRKVLGSLDSAA